MDLVLFLIVLFLIVSLGFVVAAIRTSTLLKLAPILGLLLLCEVVPFAAFKIGSGYSHLHTLSISMLGLQFLAVVVVCVRSAKRVIVMLWFATGFFWLHLFLLLNLP